ncbi:MAG: hypothetical protein IT209_07160 [Armatimonadetes bacterium]|nr:hypothetical protein [Armatimonadota bacterium]
MYALFTVALASLCIAISADAPVPVDAISREFSAYVGQDSSASPVDAISREFSAYVGQDSSASPVDAISREFTAYVGQDSSASPVDAISREFSAYAGGLLAAKKLADSEILYELPLVVTAVWDGFFYAQDEMRSGGIRFASSAPVHPGDSIRSAGTIQTNADLERYVQPTRVAVLKSGARPEPLTLITDALGGGDWFYDLATGKGQRGVFGSYGLNNIGLLVQICGHVTSVDETANTFTVWDGSSITAADGNNGVRVWAPGLTLPNINELVTVTGISSCEKVGNNLYSLLRVREAGDIQTKVQ